MFVAEPLTVNAHTKILVIGGSPHPCTPELLRQLSTRHDLVIACDSGLNICQQARVVPQIVVGDLDSVSPSVLAWAQDEPVKFIASHWHKDETDLGMALRLIHEAVYGPASTKSLSSIQEAGVSSQYWVDGTKVVPGVEVTLTSCTGGRLDHQLAIVGKLMEFAHLLPCIVEDSMSATLLHTQYRSKVATTGVDRYKTASAIALTPQTILSLTGFEWELNHQQFTLLDMGALAGTSNIVTASSAEVEVHSGALIFIVNNMLEMKKLYDLGVLASDYEAGV